jgi:hypothetical protein
LAGKITVRRKIFWAITGFFFVMFLIDRGTEETTSTTAAIVASETLATPDANQTVSAEESAPAGSAAAEAESSATAEERANNERYGVYCLSLWDGSHDGFVAAVKDAINDPASFEHDSTRTWPVNAEGRNTILMNFRARNALGGMIRVKAAGSFDNDSCSDVRIDLIE